MINFTEKQLDFAGFDMTTAVIHHVGVLGFYHIRDFAIKNDLDIASVKGFRLEKGKWIACHVKNPTKGFKDVPVLSM